MEKNNYDRETNKQISKKDILAVMIAQFLIVMPWVFGFCLALFGIVWLSMKYWS